MTTMIRYLGEELRRREGDEDGEEDGDRTSLFAGLKAPR
jgi:hypothetical protein